MIHVVNLWHSFSVPTMTAPEQKRAEHEMNMVKLICGKLTSMQTATCTMEMNSHFYLHSMILNVEVRLETKAQ